MRTKKLVSLSAFLIAGILHSGAATVLYSTDFSSLTNGDLNGQTSISGSSTMTWSGDANMDVSNGQLVSASGSTIYGALDSSTMSALNTSNEVWFSIDLRTSNTSGTNRFGLATDAVPSPNQFNGTATVGQRLGGVQTRVGSFVSAEQINTTPATTSASEAFTTSGWAANTTYTIVGKLTINRTAGAVDVLQFWYGPQGSIDINNPGTASITMNGIDLIGPTTQITGVVFQGNQSGLTYDNMIIAVPEPATAGLAGFGLLAFIRRRRSA